MTDGGGAARAVTIKGDGTGREVAIGMRAFEALLGTMGMRQYAFEPTGAFRPHEVGAPMLIQRMDRMRGELDRAAAADAELARTMDQLRDIAEMSGKVRWN